MSAPSANLPAHIIDDAIEDTKMTLFILQRRKEGESFGAISSLCGLSKSACYDRFLRACNRIDRHGGVDAVDESCVTHEDNTDKKDA